MIYKVNWLCKCLIKSTLVRLILFLLLSFTIHQLVFSTARKLYYIFGQKMIHRAFVPAEKVPWSVEWSQYDPVKFSLDFTSKPWADPDIKFVFVLNF